MKALVLALMMAILAWPGLPVGAADDTKVKDATRSVETGAKKIGEGKVGQGVELPELQDPQRCPEPPRGHAHLVYRILFRDDGLVPLQCGHLIEEEAGLGHGSLTLPVVQRSR